MSIEQRLRDGLQRSVADIDPSPVPALARVEGRVRRSRRTRARVVAVVAAAATVAIVVLMVPVVQRLTSERTVDPARPAGVEGSYVVEVPDTARLRRASATGRWLVTLAPEGVMRLTPPPTFPGEVGSDSYRVEGDVLRSNVFIDEPGCQASDQPVGTYRWEVSEGGLVFTLVEDTCPARRALFASSTWQRVG